MEKGYMKEALKQYIPLSMPFVILILASLWIGNMYKTDNIKESKLAHSLYSFAVDEKPWEAPNKNYTEGSAELLFLEGMEFFLQKEYQQAQDFFHKSLMQPRKDPALPIYTYFYINKCIYQLTGKGSVPAVTNALNFMAQYEPLVNNTQFLWSMIQTIVFSDEQYDHAITVMESYLSKAINLTTHSKAWIINTMAMLEHQGGEHEKSIRRFYDVEILLSQEKTSTPELEFELLFAWEYIANIKFLLEDYEGAIEIFSQLIQNETPQDNFTNYLSYINLADSYLEIGKSQEALVTIQELQKRLPQIPQEERPEIEANIHDILANIFMMEGNLPQAYFHLQQSEAFYNEQNDTLLLNGKYATILTRCKYLKYSGDFSQAQAILQELVQQESNIHWPVRKEALELLEEIYLQTGQKDKLITVYQNLLQIEHKFKKILQNAYLEFSGYYRENNFLRQDNTRLKQGNIVAILGIIIISSGLIIILILFRLLSMKNLTDQLTGIYNRKKLIQLSRLYRRRGTPEAFAVIMLDIDYFKLYNDTYGHVDGDKILKQVAKILMRSVRSNDFVIRYGGEEFLVFLNNVTINEAQSVCCRIHQELETVHLPHKASQVADHVTVSIGLCYQQEQNTFTMDKFIQQADESLYQSKEAGRNRTTLWQKK